MTVILYDNHNPGMRLTTDTVMTDSLINSTKAVIDLYFCANQFHIPYYVPTGGIYKDSIKEKECDLSIYPQIVKCYTYDKQNRVIQMSCEGSGTMGTWNYAYDNKNRVTDIEWLGTKYSLKYNDLGLLTELTECTADLKKKLQIIYH